MSNLHSSLALDEEIKASIEEPSLNLIITTRHLSTSCATPDIQPLRQVIKVSGGITVSF